MADVQKYLEYNDPLTIIVRSGSPTDPYKDRADSLPVINNMITLLEIPSKADRVTIAGMTEIDQEVFENRPHLSPTEFLVNYSIGAVQVHSSLEGTAQLCRFKGKGLIMYPASRIYALTNRNPDVVVTLQDYIEEIQVKLNETYDGIARLEQTILQSVEATNNAILATDNANKATQDAQSAAELARSAYDTTRLVFKEPVATLQNIPSKYPSPLVGWTVQTYKDGKRYRFDGSRWIEIDVFGSNLQVVNEFKDGLMSVLDYQKLKSFPVDLKEQVIAFSLPDAVQGVIENFIPFPFSGEITELSGYCATSGEMVTSLSLERTRDLKNWSEVTDRRLQFEPNQNFDDKKVTFKSSIVSKGDIFRINLNQQGLGIYNITVLLKIKI
ncbi:hypothetical protein [Paenibacillus donghaensis]|uniref:Uncharacterized protein n=1 Tax=Paenibacillus donghaensis TaxID=414771 RepID=A0A2Z2KK94_9BACL|nr:hypothetical protein [Paenibacillus donghaensis]ASA22779.1 hypothetical protein B9T62_19420 [Paenibacillus donghaensis]